MLLSLIICTRNRCEKLENCLNAVAAATKASCEIEIVVVDNGSQDDTEAVFRTFESKSSFPARYVYHETPGLSAARNAGVAASIGKWLLFTDDDCYIDREYFTEFHQFVRGLMTRESPISYGTGPIHFYDEGDDRRIAVRYLENSWEIPKNSLLTAGVVQGANMFFRRKVFDSIGGFDERLGAGTPFPCEDIEMATRASLAGFVGIQLPSVKVFHHHGRRAGSPEADATVEAYDYGRGAYYAGLLQRGHAGAFQIWATASAIGLGDNGRHLQERLAREFAGAADFLKRSLAASG
jgi:glycosyltransferase involved in cell wall biosynthesis